MTTAGLSRFIPACAGNRADGTVDEWERPVHPRVCGEQVRRWHYMRVDGGSSPRVRGTERLIVGEPLRGRFIPACAGNSRPTSSTWLTATVHPRVCGEQMKSACDFHECDGSSPRVRGTDQVLAQAFGRDRFIPACAGNSGQDAGTQAGPPVHPRVCGEQRQCTCNVHHTHGSSPRVRGTDDAKVLQRLCQRFIPACAGNRCHGRGPQPNRAVHPRVCGEQGGCDA